MRCYRSYKYSKPFCWYRHALDMAFPLPFFSPSQNLSHCLQPLIICSLNNVLVGRLRLKCAKMQERFRFIHETIWKLPQAPAAAAAPLPTVPPLPPTCSLGPLSPGQEVVKLIQLIRLLLQGLLLPYV